MKNLSHIPELWGTKIKTLIGKLTTLSGIK